ncbi:MAG TPA: RNA methyltransferase [Vicinamibacterales bacterium]|nr:RNA methyltransferase [Vicinamibacterales bacterium]
MQRITSRQNPLVRRFREISRRRTGGDVVLEGAHLLAEALASGVPLDVVAFREPIADETARLAERARHAGARTVIVTPPVLDAMSPVRESSGVVAIGRCEPAGTAQLLGAHASLILLVDAVQDPGNLGAIVRAAEGCGASGMATGAGTADPFGWRALRGSMGSAFRVPIAIHADLRCMAQSARDAGLRVFATVPRGGTPLPDADFRQRAAILLGGEGSGLPDDLIAAADERLTIPMRPPVESLNVAAAAAIILYEAQRQRSNERTSHVAIR